MIIKKCNDSEYDKIDIILNTKLFDIKDNSETLLIVATIKLFEFILDIAKSYDIINNIAKLLYELYYNLNEDLDYKTIYKSMFKLPFEGNIHQFIFYIDGLYNVNVEESRKWIDKKIYKLSERYGICDDEYE